MHLSLASISLFLASLISLVSAHNIHVEPRRRECFFEDLHRDDRMTVSFVSGPGEEGNNDIDFWVTGPDGTQIVKQQRLQNGDYSFTATNDGTFPDVGQEFDHSGTKEISFNVHGIVYVAFSEEEADPLEREVRTLAELLQQVKDEQEYIKVRERVHRNTAESTNSRVKWWSIFQTGVLVGVCVFQVAYLKRFFEVKRTV